MNLIIYFILAYLIGSISPSYIAGKLRGKDLRKFKSKNLGGANVYRAFGLLYAIPVVIFDIAKGILPVVLGFSYGFPYYYMIIAGGLAILGHNFPFYLGFRGGKGTATSLGALFGFAFFSNNFNELIVSIISIAVIYIIAKIIVVKTQNRKVWG